MSSKNNLMAPLKLLIDPKLPKRFNDKANGCRSAQELNKWWDKPFAVLLADGQYEVRCLDGGAWDRSTVYGVASDLAAAEALAADKLNKWKKVRAQPHVTFCCDERWVVIRWPQRPDEEMELLYETSDQADAVLWLEEYDTLELCSHEGR